MRSRTELVTTTFEDSEEEYSEDDDSEEDWRPTASNKNGKKQTKGQNSGTRKRKLTNINATKSKRKMTNYKEDSDDDDNDDIEDDFDDDDNDNGVRDEDDIDETELSDDDFGYANNEITNNMLTANINANINANASGSSSGMGTGNGNQKKLTNLPPKKQFVEQNATSNNMPEQSTKTLELLLNKRDLIGDFAQNNRLCLWRKDDNNLLQKYIRVKTTPEEFLFTSSSVYSSWDDQRITDFVSLKVNCLDPNNRRVKVDNISILQNLAINLEQTDIKTLGTTAGSRNVMDAGKQHAGDATGDTANIENAYHEDSSDADSANDGQTLQYVQKPDENDVNDDVEDDEEELLENESDILDELNEDHEQPHEVEFVESNENE